MSAVNLLELRKEINSLLWKFTDPEEFQSRLSQLMEKYETLSFRPGYGVLSGYQTSELRVPQLVLRELELALNPTIREQPYAALRLSETLWQQGGLEKQTVAARMLAQLPLEFADAVFERIINWSREDLEVAEVRLLIRNAAAQLRQKEPEKLLRRAQEWCAVPNLRDQIIGLEMIFFLLEDPAFINLPAVFQTLEDLLPKAGSELQSELTEILQLLLNRSQTEASFFVRQQLEKPNHGKVLPRIARKLLKTFSSQSLPRIQELLRSDALSGRNPSTDKS